MFFLLNQLLIIVVCIKDVHLQVTLTSVTSKVVIGKELVLKCEYSGANPCCSGTPRVWNRDGLAIVSDGVGSSRYKEEIFNSYFTLTVQNFEEDDLNKPFQCQYQFSTSSQMTFSNPIKLPTESCIVNNDKRSLDSTLQLTRISPYPTIFASYGDKNLTSDITVTTSALYDTYFYNTSVEIKLKDVLTCGNGEKFLLGCDTDGVITNICDNKDFCKCGECAGWDFMYASIVPVAVVIGVVIFGSVKITEGKKTLIVAGGTLAICLVVNVAVAIPIGLLVCHCIDGTAPAFIVLGSVVSISVAMILKKVVIRDNGVSECNSGSSCWPPCKVDQEPDSKKSRGKPDKRSEPKSESKHIKTDNNLTLSEKEPLPGIISPRPLPMPPTTQGKGGIKLEPVDNDSLKKEKKKKKKKKKNNDEEKNNE